MAPLNTEAHCVGNGSDSKSMARCVLSSWKPTADAAVLRVRHSILHAYRWVRPWWCCDAASTYLPCASASVLSFTSFSPSHSCHLISLLPLLSVSPLFPLSPPSYLLLCPLSFPAPLISSTRYSLAFNSHRAEDEYLSYTNLYTDTVPLASAFTSMAVWTKSTCDCGASAPFANLTRCVHRGGMHTQRGMHTRRSIEAQTLDQHRHKNHADMQ